MPFISNAYLRWLQNNDPAQYVNLLTNHIPLGYHPDTHDNLYLSNGDRYSGMYVLGLQGNGKSGLLENLIHADIDDGRAVVVIDPHGDLTDHCLAALPSLQVASTYVLDMTDEHYPFGVNLFQTAGVVSGDVARTQAVERVMRIFGLLWEEVMTQQHLPRYLRAATHVLLDNPGSTLVDMYKFLLDDDFRAGLLRNVTDSTVLDFWRTQYGPEMTDAEKTRRVGPLVNRLEALFMGRSLVRNIVGQRKNSIRFRRAIERREAIFIKLPIKTLGADAELIGTILIAQLHAAVFSFANIPESERPGVSLYIDEFQNFTTKDIDELFTEGRKFGMRLTVAHQYRDKLPGYLQDATMTARTKVCFRTNASDAREMAPLFPAQNDHIATEDLETHPVKYLLERGSENTQVRTFIDDYLRPMLIHKKGNRVEIEDTQFVIDLWNGSRQQHVYVADPTPYLDNLLYEVMRDRNPNKTIPWDAVIGFSNSGKKFTQQAKQRDDPRWGPDVTYPPHLVVNPSTAEQRWTRRPDNSTEQLYHFIYHLRAVMRYLSKHPIGKVTQASSSAVAQMLTQLPRRAAFVESGEDVGVIFTHNTPTPVTGSDLSSRLDMIRDQTRSTYCHPRQEIEATINSRAQEPVTAYERAGAGVASGDIPRWEEL